MTEINRVETTYLMDEYPKNIFIDIPETVDIGTVVAVYAIVGPDSDKLKLALTYQDALVDYEGMSGTSEDTRAAPFRLEGNSLVTAQKLSFSQYDFYSFTYRVAVSALRENGVFETGIRTSFGIGDVLDYVSGTSGDDHLRGDLNGADKIVGGLGNDILAGVRGDDVLYGGKGQDTLWGGLDRDIFVFKTCWKAA